MSSLGLYFHIPFCVSKCAYCDFYSGTDRGSAERYVAALKAQLKAYRKKAAGYTVRSVYFGGGTPTALGAGPLVSVLEAAREFGFGDGAEITAEANPGTISGDMADRLYAGGFNRLSLGVQSANGGELKTLGRAHRFEDAVEAVNAARAAGFKNLSVDIMLGIPGQSMATLSATLDAVLALNPEHVSAYLLKLEPGTEFFTRYKNGGLPGDDLQADMYLFAARRLEYNGYTQYEVSNFARVGFECTHNKGYWALRPYLGFGAAAHSDLGGRFYIKSDAAAFANAAESGDFSAVTEEEEADRPAERIMLSLRTAAGLRREDCAEFGAVASRVGIFDGKYLKVEKNRIYLKPEGFLISNTIISRALYGG